AGLPVGAVITKVGDQLISSADALGAAVQSHAPADTVSVNYVVPGGAARTAQVTLGPDGGQQSSCQRRGVIAGERQRSVCRSLPRVRGGGCRSVDDRPGGWRRARLAFGIAGSRMQPYGLGADRRRAGPGAHRDSAGGIAPGCRRSAADLWSAVVEEVDPAG